MPRASLYARRSNAVPTLHRDGKGTKMEFGFDVNGLLRERIQKIEPTTLKTVATHAVGAKKESRSKMVEIIDSIGVASGKAQELQAPVTTAEKFLSSDHILYLMKDPEGNRGRGTVVGLLKIGPKKLFLLDSSGTQNELMPLCILDFYVHESQQRRGLGKQLFQFMLEDKKIEPQSLAIDRPSSKFLAFLRKHYNLVETIPQVNNFTIFKSFFKDNSERQQSDVAAHRYSDPPGLLSFQLRDPSPLGRKQLTKSVGPNTKTSSRLDGSDRRSPFSQVQENATPRVQHIPQTNTLQLSSTASASSRSVLQSSLGVLCCNRKPGLLGNSPSDDTQKFHSCESEKPNHSLHQSPQATDKSRKSLPDYTQDYPSQLSSGRTQATRDSSLNIFGIPASWKQPAFSSKPQETLQY